MDVEATQMRGKVTDLLKKDLAGFRCLVCHNDEFVLLEESLTDVQSKLTLSAEGSGPAVQVPTLSIACTRCGRIEQFIEQMLAQRLPKAALAAP